MSSADYDPIIVPPFDEATFAQTVLAHMMFFCLSPDATQFMRRTTEPKARLLHLHRLARGVAAARDLIRRDGVFEIYFCTRQWSVQQGKPALELIFADSTGLFRLHDLHICMIPLAPATARSMNECLTAAQNILTPHETQRWETHPSKLF